MATTENLYTGDGATVLYSFTFPYIETAHIKVSVDAVDTTAYTLANATTVQFNAAPANGAAIRIYRDTPNDVIEATFYPGSSIRAQDLNNNFTQTQYVSQELKNNSLQTSEDYTVSGEWTFQQPVNGPAPVGADDYVTKAYADALAISGVAPGNKGDITVSGGGNTWTVNGGYLKPADIGVSVQAYDANLPAGNTILVDGDVGVTVQAYDADTVKTDVLPTFTVATRTTERTITAGAFDLATGNLWTVGAITVPNPTNAVAGQTGAIRITAGPVVWSSNFKFPGGSAPTITTFPAVIPYYVQNSTNILMGYVTEAIA